MHLLIFYIEEFIVPLPSKLNFQIFHENLELCLYGHLHGRELPFKAGKCYDIGVDSNNYTPISFDEIMEIFSKYTFRVDALKYFWSKLKKME